MSNRDDKGLRGRLSPEQFQVTQCSATERPFTGKFVDHKADGTYRCVCCDTPLFRAKFLVAVGWRLCADENR
jgi:peptide-methionine (R)-S-oxide reductase